jgi:dTDP-4-dehydrorhamnose 3,5-epimerase-like enzyme
MQDFASILPHSMREVENGHLGILEFADLPFVPKRIYWLTGVELGKTRGLHAHKELRQFFIALQGSVDIRLNDGTSDSFYTLRADGNGLLLAPGIWRELTNFSHNAALLVVCDRPYSEEDYIRDYDQYLLWKIIHE